MEIEHTTFPALTAGSPSVFAATLYKYWASLSTASISSASATHHRDVLLKVIDSISDAWPEADRERFIESHLLYFGQVSSEKPLHDELTRRSFPEAKRASAIECLVNLEKHNTVSDPLAIEIVIAALITRYYGPHARIDYIIDHIVDMELDDTEIDLNDGATEVFDVKQSNSPSEESRFDLFIRLLIIPVCVLAIMVIPAAIAAKIIPEVSSSYRGAVFGSAFTVVWLLLVAVYQSGKGNRVLVWRCVCSALTIALGALIYFQLGWHWVEARAEALSGDPSESLTPLPEKATPFLFACATMLFAFSLASRKRIELILGPLGK